MLMKKIKRKIGITFGCIYYHGSCKTFFYDNTSFITQTREQTFEKNKNCKNSFVKNSSEWRRKKVIRCVFPTSTHSFLGHNDVKTRFFFSFSTFSFWLLRGKVVTACWNIFTYALTHLIIIWHVGSILAISWRNGKWWGVKVRDWWKFCQILFGVRGFLVCLLNTLIT